MPEKKYPGVKRIANSHFYAVDTLVQVGKGARVHIKKKPFSSAGEAFEWLNQKRRDLEDEKEKPIDPLFADVAEGFLSLYETQNKRSTYWQTALFVRNKLVPCFEGKTIAEAYAAESLQSFRENLVDSANTPGHNNRAISLLKRITQFGFERNQITDGEWKIAQVYLKPFKDDGFKKGEIRIWTFEQYKQFISTFDKTDKYKVLFELLFSTGCRVGEAQGLQAKDFDPIGKTIDINKTAESKCGTGKIELQSPKTPASKRKVLLDQFVCDEMSKLIDSYGGGEDRFVFFGGEKPICIKSIHEAFNKHTKAAGLPHIRVHDIRHSYNTWLVEQYNTPEDLAAITKRLGRSSIKVTIDTYYHAIHNKENELVQGLNYDPKKK